MLDPVSDDFLVICHPQDAVFERSVRAAIDEARLDGAACIEDAVRSKLRERHAESRLAVHKPTSSSGADETTWVVFRDRLSRHGHGQRHEGYPDQAARQPASQASLQAAAQSDRPVALVVDDEPLILTLISKVLTSWGWRVLSAADGRDALAIGQSIGLDLLITDYGLPGLDGGTLVRRLRDVHPDLPVLVVSGQPEHAVRVEGVCHAFLGKPFVVEDLTATVESLTARNMALSGSQPSAG